MILKYNFLAAKLIFTSDEFELKFPELRRAELEGFRAEASQFSSWNRADFMYINKKQIFTT